MPIRDQQLFARAGGCLGRASRQREPEVSLTVPLWRQRTSEAGHSMVKAPPADEARGVSIRGTRQRETASRQVRVNNRHDAVRQRSSPPKLALG
jgi:hypothetical protein